MRHENGFYISDLNERKNFVRFLANGLPWRSLYSVNFRFRNLYTSCKVKGYVFIIVLLMSFIVVKLLTTAAYW